MGIQTRIFKIIKLLLFQIIFYKLSISSKIRYISLFSASETIELLLNQSYLEIGFLKCSYNSFYNPSVNISFEHLNSYFIPEKKEYDYWNSKINYTNVNIDYYLNFIFQFKNNISINQKLMYHFNLKKLTLIQRNDNTFSYVYTLENTYFNYFNMKDYSIINEIIEKCDNLINLFFKFSFDKILNYLFKIYPKSDNEFIMDKMSNYFKAMTFTSYNDDKNNTYKGRIVSCFFDSYERINNNEGIFNSVNLELEFLHNNIKKYYHINIKTINLKLDFFSFSEFKVDEYYEPIKQLINDIFHKAYNNIIKRLGNN